MGTLQYQAYKDQKLSWNSIEYKEVFQKEMKKKNESYLLRGLRLLDL